MKLGRAAWLTAACLLGGATAVTAHVRLRNSSTNNPLFWSSSGNVGIVISSAGSDNLADGSHETALRNAIAAWNGVADTTARLVEDTSEAQQARTDWEADDIHLILFDEDDSSGYFPTGSGIVALTPLWFVGSGAITDADVLFNGSAYQFTTSGFTGRFDVQDVATHELGHLLGLDHTGWAGGTMYPYVDPTVILHRSLSRDEENGLRAAYPNGGEYGVIQGRIARADGGATVAGAHVAAWDANGRSAGATLSSADGRFRLEPLPPGDYTVYARPLDQPVSQANLTTPVPVETDFSVAFHSGPVTVVAGQATSIGELLVPADSELSLGKNLDRYPLRLVAGQVQLLTVRGERLFAGSTLTCSDPTIEVTPISWLGSLVQVRFDVPAATPPSHVDLVVGDGAAFSVLTAGLEITPPDPVVDTVVPAGGPKAGGTTVTLGGSGFRPGARVVLGDRVYPDGEPGGCTVVDSQTIVLATAATVAGQHDVVVIDATGVEGRAADAWTSASLPLIDDVFPASGDVAGGTAVRLSGVDFVPGVVVRIDGVQQSALQYVSPTQLELATEPGTLPGTVELEVENPDGATAQGTFVFWNQPDPSLAAATPDSGSSGGGETITLSGAGFTAETQVFFGADPVTGEGGTPAASVTFVDAATLSVVTPAYSAGPATVLLLQGDTGQADLVVDAFQFLASAASGGSGGGGGGCGTLAVPGPPRPPTAREALAGTWFLALLALVVGLRARGAHRRLAAT